MSAAGGDVDSVGAMAGALMGVRNGIAWPPSRLVARDEDAGRIGAIAGQLFASAVAGA